MPFQPNNRLAVTHGRSRTPEYVSWLNMNARCHRITHPRFAEWGGKGITVCPSWRNGFEAFLADMGKKPTQEHTLDRYPNSNGNYEPGNVRWATPQQQSVNRPGFTRLISHNGLTKTLSDWAKEVGISRRTLQDRLDKGIPFQQAILKSSPISPEEIARNESEHAQQVALFCWMAQNFNKYPELKLAFAIPNGGERNVIVASNLKAEGVRADVSDIFLPVARGHWHGLFIELKKIKGKKPAGHPTPGQLDFITAVKAQGFAAMVAVGFTVARDALIQYLEWK